MWLLVLVGWECVVPARGACGVVTAQLVSWRRWRVLDSDGGGQLLGSGRLAPGLFARGHGRRADLRCR